MRLVLDGKAEILERSAAQVDSVIVNTQQQIDGLRERLQRERSRRDFLGRLDRFGDRVDLTAARPPTGNQAAQAGDSTVVGGLPVSLEDRVAALESQLEGLEQLRDDLLIRAARFRERVRRRSW